MKNILRTISEYDKKAYENKGKKEIVFRITILILLLLLISFMIIAFPIYSQPLSRMTSVSIVFNFYLGIFSIKNIIPILMVLLGCGVIIFEIKKMLSAYKRKFR